MPAEGIGCSVHRFRVECEVRPLAALFTRDQAGFGEQFHVVRDRALRETHWLGQVADARLAAGSTGDEGQQPDPRGITQRFEYPGDAFGILDGHRRPDGRDAAATRFDCRRQGHGASLSRIDNLR